MKGKRQRRVKDLRRRPQTRAKGAGQRHEDSSEEDDTSSSSTSSSLKSRDDDLCWTSEAFPSERSKLSYQSARVLEEEYSVNDSLWLAVTGYADVQPLLLKELWEDESTGDMWGYGTWYYYAHAVYKKRTKGGIHYSKNELFESDRGDEFPLGSIRGKIPMVPGADHVVDASQEYFCKSIYDPSTKIIRKKTGTAIVEQAKQDEEDFEGSGIDDEYDRARRVLQLSAIPNSMPCRDIEREGIKQFLLEGIKRGGSQLALYVSGMPGTGKTATFHEVIRDLTCLQRSGSIPKFKFIELNGLKLPKPEEAYSVLASLILNEDTKMSSTKACQALEAYFTNPDAKRETRVLLIDEIDQLVTKKQQLLYNLFDWPQRLHAKLVVVGIANTMDLPERLLPRIQSRLGGGRIMFAPYKREEIESIVRHRLQGIQVFDQDAIGFCARKVASVSGDVRRALQLCRRAVEICKRTGSSKVVIEHINAAVNEVDSKLHCQIISSLGTLERLFLICVHKHSKATNADKVLFQDVLYRLLNICRILPEVKHVVEDGLVCRTLYLNMADKLVRVGLLARDAEGKRCSMGPTLCLAFEYEDMRMILQCDSLLAPML